MNPMESLRASDLQAALLARLAGGASGSTATPATPAASVDSNSANPAAQPVPPPLDSLNISPETLGQLLTDKDLLNLLAKSNLPQLTLFPPQQLAAELRALLGDAFASAQAQSGAPVPEAEPAANSNQQTDAPRMAKPQQPQTQMQAANQPQVKTLFQTPAQTPAQTPIQIPAQTQIRPRAQAQLQPQAQTQPQVQGRPQVQILTQAQTRSQAQAQAVARAATPFLPQASAKTAEPPRAAGFVRPAAASGTAPQAIPGAGASQPAQASGTPAWVADGTAPADGPDGGAHPAAQAAGGQPVAHQESGVPVLQGFIPGHAAGADGVNRPAVPEAEWPASSGAAQTAEPPGAAPRASASPHLAQAQAAAPVFANGLPSFLTGVSDAVLQALANAPAVLSSPPEGQPHAPVLESEAPPPGTPEFKQASGTAASRTQSAPVSLPPHAPSSANRIAPESAQPNTLSRTPDLGTPNPAVFSPLPDTGLPPPAVFSRIPDPGSLNPAVLAAYRGETQALPAQSGIVQVQTASPQTQALVPQLPVAEGWFQIRSSPPSYGHLAIRDDERERAPAGEANATRRAHSVSMELLTEHAGVVRVRLSLARNDLACTLSFGSDAWAGKANQRLSELSAALAREGFPQPALRAVVAPDLEGSHG